MSGTQLFKNLERDVAAAASAIQSKLSQLPMSTGGMCVCYSWCACMWRGRDGVYGGVPTSVLFCVAIFPQYYLAETILYVSALGDTLAVFSDMEKPMRIFWPSYLARLMDKRSF